MNEYDKAIDAIGKVVFNPLKDVTDCIDDACKLYNELNKMIESLKREE